VGVVLATVSLTLSLLAYCNVVVRKCGACCSQALLACLTIRELTVQYCCIIDCTREIVYNGGTLSVHCLCLGDYTDCSESETRERVIVGGTVGHT